jgi:hypothetical protein
MRAGTIASSGGLLDNDRLSHDPLHGCGDITRRVLARSCQLDNLFAAAPLSK